MEETKIKNKLKHSQNTFLKTFNSLDIFGTPPSFNIEGEETYKTSLGVLWTFFLFLIITGTALYYFINFINFKSPNISSQIISLGEFPKLDLPGKNFTFAIVTFIESAPYLAKDIEEEYITISATHIRKTVIDDPSFPNGKNTTFFRKKLELKNCSETKIDINRLKNYRAGLGPKSTCLILNNDTFIQGNLQSRDFQYIDIEFRPCNESNPKCLYYNLKQDSKMTGKFSNEGDILEASPLFNATFQTIKLRAGIFYVEANADTENVTHPLVHTLNTNIQLNFEINQEKFLNYYFRKFRVQSISGKFFDYEKEVTSISLDKIESETRYRSPWAKMKITNLYDDRKIKKTQNLYTISIFASNTESVMIRNYTKFIDVLGNVGGISEIITFIIVVFYTWHNSIKMDQTVINKSFISENFKNEGKEKKKIFTYWEIFCWKFFCCCQKKKNLRKKYFEQCQSKLDERLDILNFIKNQDKAKTLQGSLLKPYQLRLLPLLKQEKKLKEKKMMSIEEAIKMLKDHEGKSSVDLAIDDFIRKRLDLRRGSEKITVRRCINSSEIIFFSTGEKDFEDGPEGNLRERMSSRNGLPSSIGVEENFDEIKDDKFE